MCRQLPTPPLIFLTLLFILPSLLSACSLHRDCDDKNPQTIDFCLRSTLCLHLLRNNPSFPTPHQQIPSLTHQQSTFATLLNLSTLLQLANDPPLTLSARLQVISTASNIYTNVSPNLFIQLTRYKFNITAALASFAASPSLPNLTNTQFHQRMLSIIHRMNDGHSRYFLPAPLAATVATLGFNVAQFYPQPSSTPAYIVNSVALGLEFSVPTFGPGAVLLRWNGRPIDSIVRALARSSTGANPPARMALALILLSVRELAMDRLPQQSAVTIQFLGTDGQITNIVIPWLYLGIRDFSMLRFSMNSDGIPLVQNTTPPLMAASQRVAMPWGSGAMHMLASTRLAQGARQNIPVSPILGRSFRAEIIRTSQGRIGRLVIPFFAPDFTGNIVPELTRLLRLMPRGGLVIDLRDNRGGDPDFAKVLTELATGGRVDAQPTMIRANEFTRRIVFEPLEDAPSQMRLMALLISLPYRTAVRTALKAGERFTGPSRNLYSEFVADTVERRVYFGPVVTLVNGRTFSGGDLFAAIQKDKSLSTIVGTDANVGAGGAATISYRALSLTYDRLLRPLPLGIDLTTAFARFFRTGRNAGGIIESFGVKPDERYFLSRKDVLEDDCDLVEFLAKGLVNGFETDRRRRR